MKTVVNDRSSVIRSFAARCCFLALIAGVAMAGCHSFHIDIAVENRTGAPIKLLEVDYPYASFGSNGLAADATFHYRIQVQGSGPLKVQYTDPHEHQVRIQGPALAEKQEGTMEIVLLPNGKAEFQPHLSSNQK